MDDVLCPTPIEITLAGQTLLLSELSDADSVALDSWVQGQCVAAARASLSEDAAQDEWDQVVGAASRAAVGLTWTRKPGRDAMWTPRGYARLVWQGLKTRHPKLTHDRVQELIKMSSPNERRALANAYLRVNGLDRDAKERKESDPQAPA